MEFSSDVSFYTIPITGLRTDWRIHINNIQSERFGIDTNEKDLGYHLFTVRPYGFSTHPVESDNSCSMGFIHGQTSRYIYGYFSSRDLGFDLTSTTGINNFNCPKGVSFSLFSNEEFSPTIPTIVDAPLSDLVANGQFKYNMAYGGSGDNVKNETLTGLPLYKYVFVENNIINKPEEYTLKAKIYNKPEVTIKPGKIFSYAFRGSYLVSLSITSKKCNNEALMSFSGEDIQMTSQYQPKTFSFTDDMIPDHCINKESKFGPGIIAAIVIAVVVVIVIIVVVVIVVKKRKKNLSSQEGNAETNTEQA